MDSMETNLLHQTDSPGLSWKDCVPSRTECRRDLSALVVLVILFLVGWIVYLTVLVFQLKADLHSMDTRLSNEMYKLAICTHCEV